MTLESIVIY